MKGFEKNSFDVIICSNSFHHYPNSQNFFYTSRFTVALHIFTCVDTFKDEHKVTSDFLAASINTNPVIIRKILTQLKNAGLINVIRGTGGIELTRDHKDITFYDVYQAIEPLED